jgi:hypothetical protein
MVLKERKMSEPQLIRDILPRVLADISTRMEARRQQDRDDRQHRIFDLWLACWTAEEIAKELGEPVSTIKDVWPKTEDLPFPSKSDQAAADHATDFDPPIYNVWKQQEKTAGSNHFGIKIGGDVLW